MCLCLHLCVCVCAGVGGDKEIKAAARTGWQRVRVYGHEKLPSNNSNKRKCSKKHCEKTEKKGNQEIKVNIGKAMVAYPYKKRCLWQTLVSFVQ